MSTVSSNDASDGASNSAYAIRPASTPSDAICRSLPGVYGLSSDCTPSILATSAKNGSITRANLLILDPVVRFEHDVADLTGALPTELVIQDVNPALALHVGQREVGAVSAPQRPHHRTKHDDSENPQQHHPATAPQAHLGQALQHGRSLRGVTGLKRTGAVKVIAPLTIGNPDL